MIEMNPRGEIRSNRGLCPRTPGIFFDPKKKKESTPCRVRQQGASSGAIIDVPACTAFPAWLKMVNKWLPIAQSPLLLWVLKYPRRRHLDYPNSMRWMNGA